MSCCHKKNIHLDYSDLKRKLKISSKESDDSAKTISIEKKKWEKKCIYCSTFGKTCVLPFLGSDCEGSTY